MVVGRSMVLEIQTKLSADLVGPQKEHRMRLAAGAVCHLEVGRTEIFEEGEVLEMIALLDSAELVVGHGISRLALPVLAAYTGIDYRGRWNVLDLETEIERETGERSTLEDATRVTLDGRLVTSDERGDRDAWRRRVELIRDLYLFGRRMGFVIVGGEGGDERVPVDW